MLNHRRGFNNIDPEVDTESAGITDRSPQQSSFQQYRSRSGYWKLTSLVNFPSGVIVFQQYRSRSGYWKYEEVIDLVGQELSFNNIDPEVDTESLARSWLEHHLPEVSTISIQKWILKASLCRAAHATAPGFNNIDPEVDTERYEGPQGWVLCNMFQQYRSRSGYWKDDHIGHRAHHSDVSTISIQKWILKVQHARFRWTWINSFNNIDPEVDTESRGAFLCAHASGQFQQYRSRSGYWKPNASHLGEDGVAVSTISIQKWILKVFQL